MQQQLQPYRLRCQGHAGVRALPLQMVTKKLYERERPAYFLNEICSDEDKCNYLKVASFLAVLICCHFEVTIIQPRFQATRLAKRRNNYRYVVNKLS